MFHILVAGYDKAWRQKTRDLLESGHYTVALAANGEDAISRMESWHTDLVIVPLCMPGMNGLEFTQTLRSVGSEPLILMLASQESPSDRKQAFRAGVDDFLPAPFDGEELLLHIQALLRRARVEREHKILLGNVTLDYDTFTVRRGNEIHVLPQKEFLLLFKLLSNPEKGFSRLDLMDEIWGAESNSGWETVTVHISRLRKRFHDWPEFAILAVRGVGYKAVKRL